MNKILVHLTNDEKLIKLQAETVKKNKKKTQFVTY